MKRIVNILLLVIVALGAYAQQVEVIDSVDYAVVRYSFPLDKPKSAYALTYHPMLCGENDTLPLKSVLVRGSSNERIVHRDYVLNKQKGREPAYIKGNTIRDNNTAYDTITLVANQYPWVLADSLSLKVRVLQDGCCDAKWLSDMLSANNAPARIIEIDTVIEEVPVDTFVPAFTHINTFKPDSFAAQLVKNNPVALQYKDYKPYDNTVVLAKDSGALFVHFPLDKVVLLREFSDNAPTLDRIMHLVNSLMEDTTTEVKVIQVIGLASIEGNVPHNEWLAGNRAIALQEYIKARIDTTGIIFEAANGGEAWTEFRWLAEQHTFHGKQRVLEIIDTNPDLNSRELWLKTLNNGRTWYYIKKHLLPPLRNSGYVKVYYNVKPDAKGQIINDAVDMLKQERYDEALRLLLKVSDDERAQNALGTAYYMTGDRDNAIRCFQRAAADGNKNAVNNLRIIEEQQQE